MSPDEITDAIVSIAGQEDAEALSESMISLTHPDLYEAAMHAFGTWDIGLAHALKAALATGSRPKRKSPVFVGVSLEERTAHPEAMRPLLALTEGGYLLRVAAERLYSSSEIVEPAPIVLPPIVGPVMSLCDVLSRGVLTVADDGNILGYDPRLVPEADAGEAPRRLGASEGIGHWALALDRGLLSRRELAVHITARGKVKATRVGDFPHVGRDPVLAFLLAEGDAVVGYVLADRQDGLFLASSNGYAIHFPVRDIRPMGLKAAGVKGMGLRGDARIIGAMAVSAGPQVVLVTRAGLGKRMPLDEFRPQSRAGLGLVAVKLTGDDEVVAIASCDDESDLALVTSRGRGVRLPAQAVPMLARPARGVQIVTLAEGETVTSVSRLLAMDFG